LGKITHSFFRRPSFNNVSDQPRNPEHQADALELEIMGFFRNNDEEDTVFQPYKNDKNEEYYIYARPIWIKKTCLKCHSTPENAPKTIRERYKTAYNYEVGDLRGLLSIKIPAKTIKDRIWSSFIQNAQITLLSLVIIFFLIMLIIRTSMIRPLSELSNAMLKVSQGDYSKRISGLTGELGIMQITFNLMGQKLEKSRKNLENRVEQRTEELSSANEDLRNILNNLQQTQKQLIESEKMASLGGLVAGVAHEINTPIGVGVTAASHIDTLNHSLLKKFETDSLKKSDLENYIIASGEAGKIILNNLNRAAELIRSFKQIAVDQTHDSHRIINVKDYTEECLISLKPLLKKCQHKVEIICPDDIKINCHPGQYSQIITNLFVNAIDHAYDKGESGLLKLVVHLEDGECYFHFSDDGKGISKENLEKIFDPFFTTARSEGGSGLGLSTIYNIITQNMKGTLRCDSVTGQGTSFYFKINPDLSN
jgi:signal transduction histidine kinase